MDITTRHCDRCKQTMPLGSLTYVRDSRTLLCHACRGRSVKEYLREQWRMDLPPAMEKVQYACEACGFTFSRATIVPKQCPYCGEEAVILAKTISTSTLLEESN